MSKIYVKLDFEKDAWNWWHACNNSSHGVNWKNKAPKYIRNKLIGVTEKKARVLLESHLNKLYKSFDVAKFIEKTQKGFDEVEDVLFERMRFVTNRPICHEKFTCFLTTFPRFPFNYEKGYIWISSKQSINYQISIFIHELLHFQYFAYFGEQVWNELGKEKHALLREAMTIILDDEFSDFTSVKDEGYKKHNELREKLILIWREVKNMDQFMDKSIDLLK